MKPSGLITLLTDFGLTDHYVGVMKGVILSINPSVRLVDITHLVGQGSILQAAELVLESHTFFPEGTVNLAVVDPGVGGERKPIAVRAHNRLFVGPDNGLFWPVISSDPKAQVVCLTEEKYFLHPISRTFHGRDIFAPVAARLSLGLELIEMGILLKDPVHLEMPRPRTGDNRVRGEIIRVDHFGNLITNLREGDVRRLSGQVTVRVAHLTFDRVGNTYADVEKGAAIALFGSEGLLEIGVNQGRACDLMGKEPARILGMPVEVIRKEAPRS